MNELNISAVDATAMETATTTSAPKHKWLSKLTRGAKKATMFCTVAGIMASTCATQAFAAGTGEVDTSFHHYCLHRPQERYLPDRRRCFALGRRKPP